MTHLKRGFYAPHDTGYQVLHMAIAEEGGGFWWETQGKRKTGTCVRQNAPANTKVHTKR